MTPPNATEPNLTELRESIAAFASARDWEQFHSPKNLSMALACEAGELMEHFLWLDPEESRELLQNKEKKTKVSEELADVLIYALRFADIAGIAPAKAIANKMKRNEERYPVEKAKGSHAKYNEL